MKNKYLSLVILLLITFIAPMIGSYATATFKEPWYSEIILPSFNPPSWVFAPVWSMLYLLMTIAIWKIWKNSFDTKILKIYFIHLFFNSTWSIVFFGFHQIFYALLILLILISLIVILIIRFKRVNITSFYLMIPYLLWCCFALFLNFKLVLLN